MTVAVHEDAPDLEVDQLLEAVFRRYHCDFRRYARPSILRGVARARASLQCATVTHLLDRVVHDPAAHSVLLRALTIQVSDFFRDPEYFRALRERVIPHLATYPSVRVWVAGCGAGEEAHSIAILLYEEGLLHRSLIYATDIEPESLRIALTGAYDVSRVRGFAENYLRAGGRASFSDYYTADSSRAVIIPQLRDRILFSDHSLATDAVFAEVQLVSCRNVLIYFNREMQERAIALFRDSLCPRGFLGLGPKETLALSAQATRFKTLALNERIYRRTC